MHGEALAWSVKEKKALPFTLRLERDLRNLQLYAPVDQPLTTPFSHNFVILTEQDPVYLPTSMSEEWICK